MASTHNSKTNMSRETKRYRARRCYFHELAKAKESEAFRNNPGAVISAVLHAGGAGPPFVVWESADAFIRKTLSELESMRSVDDALCLRAVYYIADRPTSLYFDLDVSVKDVPKDRHAPSSEELTEAFLAELQVFFNEIKFHVNVRQEAWIYSKPPRCQDKASVHVHFPGLVAPSVAVWKELVVGCLQPWLYVRALSAHVAKQPGGCLFIRKFDKNGKLHPQAWTAMDHSVYTKDRLFCSAGNGKPGRPRLEYNVALNAPSGREVPNLHDQILRSMSQSGLGNLRFPVCTPPNKVAYRQCVFPYMLGAVQLGKKQSFGPDALCGKALEKLNPLHRVFTEDHYDSLAALREADPVCMRYNGILDLDAHFDSPERKQAFLVAMQTKGIAASADEFPEFAELVAAARAAKQYLTAHGRRSVVYFSGAGMRVLWEQTSMWMKCKFTELPPGGDVAEWIARKFPPTVRKFIDSGPYEPTGGTKSDLQASDKTKQFARLLPSDGLELPSGRQCSADVTTVAEICSFWSRLLVTQPTKAKRWHSERPNYSHGTVMAQEDLVALVEAEAKRAQVDIPILNDTGKYIRLSYRGEHTCLAWRQTHSSNGGCLRVAQDGTVRAQCFSERCKAKGVRIIGTVQVAATVTRRPTDAPVFRFTHVNVEQCNFVQVDGKNFIQPIDLVSQPPEDVHVAAPKGAGKTFGIVQAIRGAMETNPNLTVLIPAPRRSLGKAHYGELQGLGFVTYSKTKGSLYQHKRVLVEYESLVRIPRDGCVRCYDLVVLDEPRCLIDAMQSDSTNQDRIEENLLIFLTALRTATRVCTIDADMLLDSGCPLLIEWLAEVRPQRRARLLTYPRETTRIFVFYDDTNAWTSALTRALLGGLVTVCCDTRMRADRLEALAHAEGLCKEDILKYTKNTMPQLEDTLMNPDANGWLTCKLVLYTSTITVGVSSQRAGSLFAAVNHGTQSARLVEQMLSRVRNADDRVHVLSAKRKDTMPPTLETVRQSRRQRQLQLERAMRPTLSADEFQQLQKRPDRIFEALGDVVAWEGQARAWPRLELQRVASYHGITIMEAPPGSPSKKRKKVTVQDEGEKLYLQASAQDWAAPKALCVQYQREDTFLTTTEHALRRIYLHMQRFRPDRWTYELYATSTRPGALQQAYTLKVAQHQSISELLERDARQLSKCGFAEFFKPVAPVYKAVTKVMCALGVSSILGPTVVDAKAVASQKLSIAEAANLCNALLKTRIKATGDAKCLSYILQALVGARFSRDSTEKGFQVVLSPTIEKIAASFAQPEPWI